MNFDQTEIEHLIKLDEMAARKELGESMGVSEEFKKARELLPTINHEKENWPEFAKEWNHFLGTVKGIDKMLDALQNMLRVQASAKKTDKLLSAGFDFELIRIDGIDFERCKNGFTEARASHFDDGSIPF